MSINKIKFILLLANFCLLNIIRGQNNLPNVVIVKNIYETIHKKDVSSLPEKMVQEIKITNPNSDDITDRYHITLSAIFKNQWEQLSIKHLQIAEMDGDKFIVEGEFEGRQATECDFITTKFRHVWSLKDGTIKTFKDESI